MALGYYRKSQDEVEENSPPSYDPNIWACDNFAIFCKTGNPNAYSNQSQLLTKDLIQRCEKGIIETLAFVLQPRSKSGRAPSGGKHQR
jgi:hypothetical protein